MFCVFRDAGAEVLTLVVAASAISASVFMSVDSGNPFTVTAAALWAFGFMTMAWGAGQNFTVVGGVIRVVLGVIGGVAYVAGAIMLPLWVLASCMLVGVGSDGALAVVLCPPLYVGPLALGLTFFQNQ